MRKARFSAQHIAAQTFINTTTNYKTYVLDGILIAVRVKQNVNVSNALMLTKLIE